MATDVSGSSDKHDNGSDDLRRQAARPARRLPRRIERRITLARVLLVWERLWPSLWHAAALVGLFVALALLGLFTGLPMALHWALLAIFALALGAALWRGLRTFRWPSRNDALRHLEQTSGLPHQPLGAYEDAPAQGTGDRALWIAHQRWVGERLRHLKLGLAAPGLAAHDPYGLRAIIILLLVIGLTGAGPDRFARVASALLPGVGSPRAISIEAWITPPAYTGRTPIHLERRDPATGETASAETTLKVPVGSTLSLRVHGLRSAPALETVREDRGKPEPLKDLGADNYALDLTIRDSAEFALTQGGRLMRGWNIEVIADHAPTIAFTKPLQRAATGALRFAYKVHDDYGVTAAQARVALAEAPRANSLGAEFSGAHHARAVPHVAPPNILLPLRAQRPREASAETYIDLTPHPWAGLPVTITLVARDDAGHEGLSTPVNITLPARKFTKPLAAAVIEQRRALAFDPSSTARVARILDDLTFDGARYINDETVYLALRAAYWRLTVAERDSDLTGIFDLLWSVALHIEDGDISLAESEVRRTRDALAQALAENAGNDEISRLMEEMKKAFQRYMEALIARNGNSDAKLTDRFAPQDGQTIDRDQLEKMMATIGDLARSGAREEARAMLEQLQAIMENMQTPNQNANMSESEKAMATAIDRVGKLIDAQRQLMDETFRHGEQSGENSDGARPGKDSANALQALKHRQEDLRKELEGLLADLEKAKAAAPAEFGKAQTQMKNAEQRLDDGRTDRATSSQGQAIGSLRSAAQGLADKLMAGRQGKTRPGRNAESQSPFGDPQAQGSHVDIPKTIDTQAARHIIEELRRRASELGRPKIELDYLDRLLERF